MQIQRFNSSLCGYYTSNNNINFVKLNLSAGRVISNPDKCMFYYSFILKGKVSAKLANYPEMIFEAGDMMFVPKYHNVEIAILENTESIVLLFDTPVNICDKLALKSAHLRINSFVFEFKPLPMREPLPAFINLILKYIEDGVGCPSIQHLKTSELFFILMNYYDADERMNFFYHLISSSMDFRDKVFANYETVKNIGELAALCNMSRSDFNRKFRTEFATTPYNWILKRKSEQIKNRLLDSDVTIKSIVLEYGFSSAAHFNSFCKKQLGSTPMQIKAGAVAKEEIV